MRHVLIAIALLCAACSLFDEYGPCPGSGTTTPAPGPSPEPPYGPGVPGDNGADRYRELSDGTVCVCGTYDIGCYETPEGAEASMACSYGPEGQTCERAAPPTSPPTMWDNESGQEVDARRKWTCTMGKYNRDSKKLVERFARSETAATRGQADDQARAWADRKNETDKVYWWALIDDGCTPTAGDASE